MRWCFRD